MQENTYATFCSDSLYHVYNRSVGGTLLFREEENYRYFLDKWEKYLKNYCNVLAYCLLPDHFHFFIKINDLSGDVHKILIEQFKRFFNSYSLGYNKYYGRHGSLLQRKFKRKRIDNEKYFTLLVYYIHHNPIHHNLVKKFSDWKYSSYHSFLSQKKTKIARNLVLSWFGGRDNFIEFHEEYKEISKDKKKDLGF